MTRIETAAEDALIIYFGERIDPDLTGKIQFFTKKIKRELDHLIIDQIPAYTTLHITYNLNLINAETMRAKLQKIIEKTEYRAQNITTKKIIIPVLYNQKTGLDLERLAREKKMTEAEIIRRHTARQYMVYAIGFAPVFAFLGTVDAKIQAPRLPTPRLKIPAGSVGIAEAQTAIYPSDSSGGWNIIGRTPLSLSLENPQNLHKFQVGDRVEFQKIGVDDFQKLGGRL